MSRLVKITSEAEALKQLHAALEGQFADTDVRLEFDQWPILTIRATGPGYDSTITPDMAEALVELQHSINRAYARLVYGTSNARKLTAQEKRDIQFKAKVRSGSSIIEVNLGDFASKLATELLSKMNSTDIVTIVLGFTMIAGSVLAYRSFLKAKSEDKSIDAETKKAIELSANETRRLEIVAKALTQQPKLRATQEDFDESRREILRGVSDAQTLEVNGVSLDNAVARKLASVPRSESRAVQLNGNYRIFKIDWQQPDHARLWLGGGHEGRQFVASLSKETITKENEEILQDAEWNRKGLYMQVNGTELRGEITTAQIVNVEYPKDPASLKAASGQ